MRPTFAADLSRPESRSTFSRTLIYALRGVAGELEEHPLSVEAPANLLFSHLSCVLHLLQQDLVGETLKCKA